MATWNLSSTATITVTPVARPNVIWTLTSTALVTMTPASPEPHKLNVVGPIQLIPYFDVNIP
jgi:hypothetical protein